MQILVSVYEARAPDWAGRLGHWYGRLDAQHNGLQTCSVDSTTAHPQFQSHFWKTLAVRPLQILESSFFYCLEKKIRSQQPDGTEPCMHIYRTLNLNFFRADQRIITCCGAAACRVRSGPASAPACQACSLLCGSLLSTMIPSMQAELQAACMRVVRWICFHEVLGNRTVLTLTMMCSAAQLVPCICFLVWLFNSSGLVQLFSPGKVKIPS